MAVWRLDPLSEDLESDDGFRRAVALILAGEPVAVPTETVYGLAADATNARACAKIFAAKDRPRFNPLISHVADQAAAEALGIFDDRARLLARAFWPGPLTLVVPKRPDAAISDLATAGLDSVGLRVPDSPIMQALAAATGRPLAAPSANRSGRISPTTAQAVADDLGDRVALVLDAGPTRVGVESTIVSLTDDTPRLLRPGGIARADIERLLGCPLAAPLPETEDGARPLAPGMLASHYAPNARVRLDAEAVAPGEALLAFGPTLLPGAEAARRIENLSTRGDLVEAAAGLFAKLRLLDASGAATIAVMPIPKSGLGEAINDRLSRAAAPRAG
ncbi:L-threonylcarbamoyladenylate synthase [Breoghania sp. L-A4]|uniref:L-threonylcarbamoyladenylate synthase n=1 Tax=Breoghania sp. L-A4 TaxID=2304600 RepID=UPI000E35A899|nr:L-threonylcarbamoyladenylate synthase [Breoghania sp. L-A4]AXS39595.1 threonylcarbamoyl-AMP synthase [Breoghania sp. L-A4]